jgi:hypothetical protein
MVQKLPQFATDENMAKALWEKSEELGWIKFDLIANIESKAEAKSEV